MADEKIRLGGLWASKMKDGTEYLSGNLGQARLMIFPNGFAKGDNDPTHIMYIVAQKPKDGDKPAGAKPAAKRNPTNDDVPW